ncbi:MAG: hypothetical protein Q9226_004458 [Calogaya cf. arnoldii]
MKVINQLTTALGLDDASDDFTLAVVVFDVFAKEVVSHRWRHQHQIAFGCHALFLVKASHLSDVKPQSLTAIIVEITVRILGSGEPREGCPYALIAVALTVIAAAIAPAAAAIPVVAGAEAGIAASAAAEAAVVATRSSPWGLVARGASGVNSYWKFGKHAEIGLGAISAIPVNVGGDAIEKAICHFPPSAPKNYEADGRLLIEKTINDNMQAFRSLIERTNADILNRTGVGENGAVDPGDYTILAETSQHGDYLDLSRTQTRRFINEPTLIEQELKTQFKNAIISVILEEQMDNEWDITLSEFLKASYAHYKVNGIGKGSMNPSVKDVFEGPATFTSGSYLPVCDTHILDQGNHVRVPCMCDDDSGSETLAFWKEAHFDNWVGGKDHDNPLYKTRRACARQVAFDDALPNFPDDLRDNLLEGPDRLCGEFTNAVDTLQSPPENNELQRQLDRSCHFCFHDPVGQNIVDAQRERPNNDWKFEVLGDYCTRLKGGREKGKPEEGFGNRWDPERC